MSLSSLSSTLSSSRGSIIPDELEAIVKNAKVQSSECVGQRAVEAV